MDSPQAISLARYAAKGNNQVGGWFFRVDAEIFRAILNVQSSKNLCGSVVEIGVHHGRSFIEMCLGLNSNEKAYCIDVFEEQNLNIDQSGHGDRQILERNLKRFGVRAESVFIESKSSMNVSAAEVLAEVGPARLFSVDGGHWLEIVKNDLFLAEACLASHGVIALDDFVRAEWPDVSAGYFAWHSVRNKAIVPFAIGANKLFLCEESWASVYRDILKQDSVLRQFFVKLVILDGIEVAIYQELSHPEWTTRKRLLFFVKTNYPSIFLKLKRGRASWLKWWAKAS